MSVIKLAKLNENPEIFFSIQGEGENIGRPSIFIRTSMCNLHCIWCDTDYTWNWEGTNFRHIKDKKPTYKKFKFEEMIIEKPISFIQDAIEKIQCRNIVLTGGEPMLQQVNLAELMRKMKYVDQEYFFEVETNGTIIPNENFDRIIDQYNVSPKLENSNNPKKLREKPKVYQFFSNHPKAIFKFVISGKKDLKEVLELVEKYDLNQDKVYLMAEGTSSVKLREKQVWLVEICKKHSFNFTDRLHIHLYGEKKGV